MMCKNLSKISISPLANEHAFIGLVAKAHPHQKSFAHTTCRDKVHGVSPH